jgi:glycosyltransferase involved in cell wall biosynthesis
MPRLLLIAFHYPPRHTIGSLRPGALAKYLPQFGWEVVVVTPQVPAGPRPPAQVIETPYEDVLDKWKKRIPGLDPHEPLQKQLPLQAQLKVQASKPREKHLISKTIDFAKSLLSYPEQEKGWLPFALDAIRNIDFPVDAILSTAPPITTHLVAKEAKLKFGCPWIADFRDLWATNLDNPHVPMLRSWDRRLEKNCLSSADVLVTVSRPWADRLRALYPGKAIDVITNGFDPDDFKSDLRRDACPKGCFSISYTGQLYAGRRDPTLLFEVVHELIEERVLPREKLRISFFGPTEGWMQPLIERHDLQGVVELHGVIPRKEALQRQQESQLLLLLGWANPQENGQHTGKLFEYFGARRPILAVGGVAGVLTEVLEETGTGMHALSRVQLRRFLIDAYAEFRERGEVRFKGNDSAIQRYTHPAMARNFAALLDARCHRVPVAAGGDAGRVYSAAGHGSSD